MRAIVQDAAGALWQYIDEEHVPLDDPGMPGKAFNVEWAHLGGWYDLSCRPVPEHAITHPVTVMWRRDN